MHHGIKRRCRIRRFVSAVTGKHELSPRSVIVGRHFLSIDIIVRMLRLAPSRWACSSASSASVAGLLNCSLLLRAPRPSSLNILGLQAAERSVQPRISKPKAIESAQFATTLATEGAGATSTSEPADLFTFLKAGGDDATQFPARHFPVPAHAPRKSNKPSPTVDPNILAALARSRRPTVSLSKKLIDEC